MTHAEEAPPYNQLPENEKQYLSLLTVPFVSQGQINNGKQVYGALCDESQKLLKDKVDQVRLQT